MKSLLPQNKFIKQLLLALGVFVSRLGVLPANISPLGGFGFFGNPFLFGVTILVFDFLVKGIYPGFWLTYIGFACYPMLGLLTKKKLKYQLLLLPVASFLFFLISNFGVWFYWYEHTLSALMLCYLFAVPFYARTLLGDLAFGYGYLFLRHHKLWYMRDGGYSNCRFIMQ